MGTNFYLNDGSKTHIGKRSSAGTYCWDCRITLCKEGEKLIHRSEPHEWLDKCPQCHKPYFPESLEESSVGRELGFNHGGTELKGVTSVSSFTWAIKPEEMARLVIYRKGAKEIEKPVVDEYGTEYTVGEWGALLDRCPIRFYEMIGELFS